MSESVRAPSVWNNNFTQKSQDEICTTFCSQAAGRKSSAHRHVFGIDATIAPLTFLPLLRDLISAPGKSKCTTAALCVVSTALSTVVSVLPKRAKRAKRVGAVSSDRSSKCHKQLAVGSGKIKQSMAQLISGLQRHRAQEGQFQT